MSTQLFRLKPIAKTFGMEVEGISIKDGLDDDVMSALVSALAHHALLLFRSPGLTHPEQVAFTERLGEKRDQFLHPWAPATHGVVDPANAGNPDRRPVMNTGDSIYFVNGPGLSDGQDEDPDAVWDEEDGHYKGFGTSAWHTGDTEKVDVEVANILYAEVAPKRGGATLFCDTTASYETLDDELKRKLDELRAVHLFTTPVRTPPVSQALVKQHSMTGRKFLYLNFECMDRIEGLSKPESDNLMDRIFRHQFQPDFVYTHKWQDGDMIMWNCNGTMHKRGALVTGERRILRRTQVGIPALQSTRPWDKTRLL